jgi:peptidoglycan/LPS O-acetylase OafA/YrhL
LDGQRHTQIDGLRALAMTGVLYVHFWDRQPLTENLRVSLFFTVSGFLITHILIAAKESGRPVSIGNFYIRRALRLFPALFVLGAAAVIFDMDGARTSWPWHVLQASNLYFALHEQFSPWVFSHLWSLNILEQFYLIWPLVILLMPIRGIFIVTLGMLVGSAFVYAHGNDMGLTDWTRRLIFQFDPIASGALTYLLVRHNRDVREVVTSRWALLAALMVMASPFFLWPGFGEDPTYRLMCQPALGVVVAGAWRGYRGPVGWLLGCRVAQFISRISYGVFMYHLAIWWAMGQIGSPLYDTGPLPFFAMTALSLLAATLSWYLIEEPISRLKQRFPTVRSGREILAPEPVA